jgi:hypothetical protein
MDRASAIPKSLHSLLVESGNLYGADNVADIYLIKQSELAVETGLIAFPKNAKA